MSETLPYVQNFQPDDAKIESAMGQIERDQRLLDYDTKEYTIELLVLKFGNEDDSDIFVPPYQRHFIWDPRRQSRFIESLLVGLPVPFLFFAELRDGRLEIIDGRQRLSTCKAFLEDKLELQGMERLVRLEGFRFQHLSKAQQRRFKNRTIRSVVVSEKATEDDRRDLFDRINTGSLIANPAETRVGAIRGPMTDLIRSLTKDQRFKRLCPVPEAARRRREEEELVVRFFVFSDGLKGYQDQYTKFLNSWLRRKNQEAENDPSILARYRARFHQVMEFVEKYFPHGFKKKVQSTVTPRVRFDAIAVGSWKALEAAPALMSSGPDLPVNDWLNSDGFILVTTSNAANVLSKIRNRFNYVTNMLLGEKTKALACVPGGETDEGY